MHVEIRCITSRFARMLEINNNRRKEVITKREV